jgi:tetratricopeptide (TPR) repeat protein
MKLSFFIILLIATSLSAQNQARANFIKDISSQIYEGQTDTALAALDSLIESDPTDASLFYLKGRAYSQIGDNTKALIAYHHTVALDSTHVNALVAAAKLHDQAGYYDRSVIYFNKALEMDSTRYDVANQLGQLYFNHLNYKKSLDVFTSLSEKNPQNASYMMMTGKCQDKLHNPMGALPWFKRAHHVDSTNVSCLYHLGMLYYKVDEPDSSLMFIDKGLQHNPKHPYLHLLRGNIRYDKKEYEGAIVEYKEYEANTAEVNPVVMKKQGFAYFRMKNYEKAMQEFSRALFENKEDAVSYFYVGLCLKQLGVTDIAIKLIENAIELSIPETLHSYYAELADCYHQLENYEQAIFAFRRALFYKSDEENYIYGLANVYYDYYADRHVPLRYYEMVVENNDNPEIVQFARARVKELKEEIHFHP